MKNNQDIKISLITGESVSAKFLQDQMAPILERINAQLLQDFKPPETVAPAQAANPTAHGFFGSVGLSTSLKDVTSAKHGTTTDTFTEQDIVERKTLAVGFMGIGKYKQEIRDKLVTTVPPGPFQSAYLMLPPTAGAEDLGIAQIDFEAKLNQKGQNSPTQLATWKPSDGWKDAHGKSRQSLAFGLLNSDPQDSHFECKTKVATADQQLEIDQQIPAFTGHRAFSAINESALDVVTIDASNLTWKGVSSATSGLIQMNVTLTRGTNTFTKAIRPRQVGGVRQPPDPVRWLLARDAAPLPVKANSVSNG